MSDNAGEDSDGRAGPPGATGADPPGEPGEMAVVMRRDPRPALRPSIERGDPGEMAVAMRRDPRPERPREAEGPERGAGVATSHNTGAGVGPHPGPWPDDDRLDPELLAGGDRRNVVDRYRYWTVEAIRDDLDRSAAPLEVAIENWEHDFNIGTVVRNANAFGVRRVHIVGRRRWNRRGAMVTDRYLHVEHHDDIAGLAAHAARHALDLVAVENTDGAVPLETASLPERSLMIFGQERGGVSPQALAAAELTCAITMHGSTRSLNAGVASGIAMFAWCRQHATYPRGV